MDSNDLDIERIFEDKSRKKDKSVFQTDKIEPWKDEPQTIPHELLNTQNMKVLNKKKFYRKYGSLQIQPNSPVKSPTKQNRLSRQLPKMQIGSITLKKVGTREKSAKSAMKKRRRSETMLPTLSVARNLEIERKLYIMKHKTDSPTKSPPRKNSLRQFIEKNDKY